jgi:SAM-dependent methyltransferase
MIRARKFARTCLTRVAIALRGPSRRWAKAQEHEVDYWTQHLGMDAEQRRARSDPERILQTYLMRLIHAAPGRPVEILDVGAGPLTFVGPKFPGHELRITAIDPNAAEYDRILTKLGITPPFRTRQGFAEDLASVVPMNFFDLVHSRNAIDHSKDPMRAIEQMVQAVKPGCAVFLNHYISEGRRNDYGGPHQWNLFPRDGRFLIDRPGLRAIDVGERLKDNADVSIGTGLHGPESFTATITRHS